MSPPTRHSPPPPPRRLTWDGVSLAVPGNWELGFYQFLKHGITRIEVEDEYALRLEAEWVRPRDQFALARLQRRYETAAQRLTAQADSHAAISGLPAGWVATDYAFARSVAKPNHPRLVIVKEHLVTAFYTTLTPRPANGPETAAAPLPALFCYVILHFLPEDREDPRTVMRDLAGGFVHHPGPLIPWELFDIAFPLPREFLLENTLFDIGAKLMIFRWRLRRFYLWHFSLADTFLGERAADPRMRTPEAWAAGYLNSYSRIRPVVFGAGRPGELTARRRRRYFLGHRDEISRWCFRWRARCFLDPAKNQLIVWVFSYRRDEDLERIPPDLRFSPA